MNTTSRPDPWEPATSNPILCRCWAWRHNLVGDHIDHVATLKRNRALGLVPNDWYFATIQLEARLDPSEVAE
jgi:hypothetical protein